MEEYNSNTKNTIGIGLMVITGIGLLSCDSITTMYCYGGLFILGAIIKTIGDIEQN